MAAARAKYYYGWSIAAALAITETISWGIIYYTFSVYITPMEAEMGWSRTDLTAAFSLALLIAGALAFPVGYWVDRQGPRVLMTAGSVAASLLVLAWSQVNSLPALYLIWAGLGFCFAAVLYEPAFAVIATWFIQRRGQALALVTFAAGLASTIFVPLADALLHTFGWRSALLILAVFLAVTTIPLHAIVLRRHPSDLGLLPDGAAQDTGSHPVRRAQVTLGAVLRNRSFWLITLAFCLSTLGADAIRVHFIPFLIDSGIDPSTAAFATGSIGMMQVAGRLIFAPLDSRLSSRVLVGGVFALQALAVGLLLLGTGVLWIGVFIVIFGAVYGARTLARPAILADLYGSSHYGRISSVMTVFLTLARTAAPVGTGYLYDRFGGYDVVLWVILALSLCSVLVMAFVRPEAAANFSAENR